MTDQSPQSEQQILEVWTHALEAIPPEGLEENKTATENELALLSKALSLVDCDLLTVSYTLRPTNHGTYELKGTLSANVTQNCVITLEPVQAVVQEKLKATFAHLDTNTRTDAEEEQAILNQRSIEPILNETIDVGMLVFETFSTSIEPYPKKPGAKLELPSTLIPQEFEDEQNNPFAVLAQLKDSPKKN